MIPHITTQQSEVTEEEKKAALKCARAAYKSVKLHQSQIECEQEMAYLSACGVDIGELNHSREFSQRMMYLLVQ
jgi:imidazolonepropionase-like amidohydrolase